MIRSLPDAEGVVQLELLDGLGRVRHGFATRTGRLESVAPTPIARLHQVHAADVLRLPSDDAALQPFLRATAADRPAADALLTDRRDVTVAIAVADCLPILIADRRGRAVAAVHGGWRGMVAGVLENTIEAMSDSFGCRAEELVLGIGPAIGPCCFEVGPEVIDALAARGYGDQARVDGKDRDKPYCDLEAVARAVALESGIPATSIASAHLCTLCNSDWLWSYRADGRGAGRMICGIALTGS